MSEETLKSLLNLLGAGSVGGIIGAIITKIFDWLRISKSEKRISRLSALENQLQHLYGPLYFFTSQNEKCFALNNSIQKAYQREYVEQKFSNESHTQEKLKKDTTTTLDIGNAYLSLVIQNNERIIEILRDNYSFIDPEDEDIFQQFVVDCNRLRIEREESGNLKTPLEIYSQIGEISFMRPDFIQRVKTKFIKEKTAIERLNR